MDSSKTNLSESSPPSIDQVTISLAVKVEIDCRFSAKLSSKILTVWEEAPKVRSWP